MINTKLQNIIDTKSAIGNAIVNKGGTITSETPFFNYAAQIDGISTGTPQTIFQASDGSKWALTNAVNLTNVSNNVTSDFNYWQPANNSTSDPILNIGTVGANISGNIRLVPVNQVNIAQYVNIVATDINGAKYEGFNGYDSQTNPTPTGNTTFNRWLLNNSATGTVIFANATFTTGIYNGPNIGVNEANLAFVNNTANYGGAVLALTTNNGFIYAGGDTNQTVQKFYESNLAFVGNTANYGGPIRSLTTNNGFIFAVGFGDASNGKVQKFYESNLARENNSAVYAVGYILSVTVNNGFVYVGGFGPGFGSGNVSKYHESNLVFVANTAVYGGPIFTLTTNNGFIYAGGESNRTVQKFHESNLARVGNTASYGGDISSLTTNNGFIYVGGSADESDERNIKKYHESNLAFVGNTAAYGGSIRSLTTNNGFIYAGGTSNRTVQKFYESNLTFVGNSIEYGGDIRAITTNNGFIYAGGETNRTVQKFEEAGLMLDNQTFYTATKIKE
jgi:hypothetical protein